MTRKLEGEIAVPGGSVLRIYSDPSVPRGSVRFEQAERMSYPDAFAQVWNAFEAITPAERELILSALHYRFNQDGTLRQNRLGEP